MEMNKSAILEGLLYIVGEEGLSEQQVADCMDISLSEAENLFLELQKSYNSDDRGIEIVHYGEYYKFVSKAEIHEYAQKLFADVKQSSLSQSALETLAIVAYKQPITRVEIEEIRGVGCDMMLRKLQARNLIEETGRSDAPGRPILYGVTQEFMDSFKLLSLKELPDLPTFEREQEDLFD